MPQPQLIDHIADMTPDDLRTHLRNVYGNTTAQAREIEMLHRLLHTQKEQRDALLAAWESRRNYWYMNYYQDSNQPLIENGKARVFDTTADMLSSMGSPAYRCPACKGVSINPYACTTGLPLSDGRTCDWKVFGLFGHMGKGIYVFVKDRMIGENIFMPVAWESEG